MDHYLVQHALKNVWCSPEQDRQYLLQPARLTGSNGARHFVSVEWDRHWLPDQTHRYHVYQIGQLAPGFLDLIPSIEQWFSAQQAVNSREVILDFYDSHGRHFPLFACYFKKTRTRNLIIAVRDLPTIGDLTQDTLFVRFYSNAYFDSTRRNSQDRTYTNGTIVKARTDTVVLNNEINQAKQNRNGVIYTFQNGWLVDQLRPDHVATGDIIEYVQDTSIKEVFNIQVKDLHVFNSTLDSIRKYLVPRLNKIGTTIDFQDDLDVYVYRKVQSSFQGIFYHRPNANAIRMVTHRDYSVPVQNIIDQANKTEGWDDSQELFLRFHIRHSGYYRKLVNEHHRIKDLYRLDDAKILQAMVGANANVTEWQAASLEASWYTKIMRATSPVVAKDVKLAYGYNAVSRLVGRSLDIPHDNGATSVTNPAFLVQHKATMYEYDKKGRLIDFYHHDGGAEYPLHNPTIAGYVENISGIGSGQTSTTFGQTHVTVAGPETFKAFVCDKIGDVPSYNWRAAVAGTDYTYDNGQVNFSIDVSKHYTAVREVSNFLSKKMSIKMAGGFLSFKITSKDLFGTERQLKESTLPFGKLDLFLNSHPLIENLDYFVEWPQVVICNKEYLDQNFDDQIITVRAYGQPDDNMKRLPVAEYGFVKHGLLSVNNRFDIRDDKNMRYVINGRIIDQSALSFIEDRSGVTVDFPEGTPYMVDEVIVPMDTLSDTNTYDYRDVSLDLDKRIEDYLTQYYPQPKFDQPVIIPQRYELYSPFLSRIHDILQSGFFHQDEITGQYSDADIKTWLADYEWLLDYDPVIQGVDTDFVTVHPHQYFTVTELDIYRFNFLQRVSKVYLQDKIDLSHHVRIKEGWV